MKIDQNILWFGLKSCLYCGSLFPKDGGLCRQCSRSLWLNTSDDELFSQALEKFDAHSLFHWVPGEQEVLSRLVHALKGGGGESLWSHYAEELWRRYLTEVFYKTEKSIVFVPSPSRKLREKDHATIFAECLAEISGGSVCFCLAREEVGKSQKKRSRAQRFRVGLTWAENFSLEAFQRQTKGKRVVFVDDIVTTGATALAAWKTLGKPRDFAVWALAQRGLPCGVPTDLV